MKSSWVWLIALNLLMIVAFYYVQQDISARELYWLSPFECHPYIGSSCFEPSFSRSFLFYVLSATCTKPAGCGDTHIPGTLTFDWSQAALLVAVVADVATLLRHAKKRTSNNHPRTAA